MAQKKHDAPNYGYLPSLDPLDSLDPAPGHIQELEEAQAQRSEFRWSLATGSSGLIWVDSVDDVDFDSQILFGWFILVQ